MNERTRAGALRFPTIVDNESCGACLYHCLIVMGSETDAPNPRGLEQLSQTIGDHIHGNGGKIGPNDRFFKFNPTSPSNSTIYAAEHMTTQ